MRLTKKQKQFLYDLFNRDYTLAALSSAYDNNDPKQFKDDYGVGIKTGEKYFKHFISELQKDLTKQKAR